MWRNPTVGYIQGMNYLVFRIRKVLSEEDTFWTFCAIVETYMQPDYYVDMYGAISQAEILSRIFVQYNIMPEVRKVFERLEAKLVTFSVNWFISIFTATLPEQPALKVLDLFFLKGQKTNKIVFDVSLALLSVLKSQIVECDDQSDFYTKIFNSQNEALQDGNRLIQEAMQTKFDLR